jgi:hypothetical protein
MKNLHRNGNPIVREFEKQAAFENSQEHFAGNVGFYYHMKELVSSGVLQERIAPIVVSYMPFLQRYLLYAARLDVAIRTLKRLRERKPEVKVFLETCEMKTSESLENLLQLPIARST